MKTKANPEGEPLQTKLLGLGLCLGYLALAHRTNRTGKPQAQHSGKSTAAYSVEQHAKQHKHRSNDHTRSRCRPKPCTKHFPIRNLQSGIALMTALVNALNVDTIDGAPNSSCGRTLSLRPVSPTVEGKRLFSDSSQMPLRYGTNTCRRTALHSSFCFWAEHALQTVQTGVPLCLARSS